MIVTVNPTSFGKHSSQNYKNYFEYLWDPFAFAGSSFHVTVTMTSYVGAIKVSYLFSVHRSLSGFPVSRYKA